MHFSFVTSIALALTHVLAAPTHNYECDVSHAKPPLPSNPDISIPDDARPQYIALAIGTQNYTCTNTKAYRSTGAISTLVDISCLYKSDSELFEEIQDSAYSLLLESENNTLTLDEIEDIIRYPPYVLGEHYFIPQNGAIVPKFDFEKSQEGNENAFAVGRQLGATPSPVGSRNIDWLQLEITDGELATYVFRVDTHGGQAPETCHDEGQDITVPYTAKYWFFN